MDSERLKFLSPVPDMGVNFYETKFPATKTPLQSDQSDGEPDTLTDGLIVDDVQFQQPANFEWQQIEGRVNTRRRKHGSCLKILSRGLVT